MKQILCVAAFAIAALVAPFAAQAAQEPVRIAFPGGHIYGTLTVPDTKGPVPVALIIAGSGPTDRDGNGPSLTTNAYKKLAIALAARGIATLRYDKRGIGASHTTQTESQLRLNDYVNDALTLTAMLEKDPRFSSVAIIGHSEGSLIGILAAERDAHVRSLVSLEGAGRDLATIINEQVRANAANPPAIIKEVIAYNAQLSAGHTVPNPDPLLAALFRPSVQPYLISEYQVDPGKEIAKLAIPVLIVHGTHDIQVSATDAARLKKYDPKATLVTIDGMNHILVNAPADRAGNIATYNQPELPLNAILVNTLASFLTNPKYS